MDPRSSFPRGATDPSAKTAEFLRGYAERVRETLTQLPWQELEHLVDVLHQARLCRASVFIGGNGGSWATASHMVNDLNKGAIAAGVPRFRSIGLGDNVPLLTAWSNDNSYDRGLVEPLRNLGCPGDVLVAISCSGSSRNVIEAARYARSIGLFVVGLTGAGGGALAETSDLPIVITNDCVEQLEDVHMFLDHLLVSALRERAATDVRPNLVLPGGRGATPEHPVVSSEVPARPAIMVDRDGVINANLPDHVRRWDELAPLPGSIEALVDLARLGAPIVIVTNQAAIARGQITFDMVDSLNLRLMDLVARHGGRIDATVSCPHHPDQHCGCRKPMPGMLTYASATLNLDLARSVMVGDALTDAQAAQSAGARPILVRSGRVSQDELFSVDNMLIVDDLACAVPHIVELIEAWQK